MKQEDYFEPFLTTFDASIVFFGSLGNIKIVLSLSQNLQKQI
jgi:hypothetical protein